MKKPKALIVASVASMIDQFNMANIKLLQQMNYEVHIACNFVDGGTIPSNKVIGLKKNLDDLDVTYYQVDFDRNPISLIENFKALQQMKTIMKKNYDLVHSHSPIGGAIARLTANKYRKKGLKSIYTAHGFHFYEGAPWKNWVLYYPIEKILSNFTDKLITINKEDYYLANNKFYAKETIYIPGIGIDLTKFKPINKNQKNCLRKKLGFKSDEFLLIYVGELSYRKNQKMLLKSMLKLIKKNDNIKLLLVGEGPLKKEYKNFINNNNLNNKIQLLGYRKDIKELMGISDLAVSTSRQEGLPVNIMEAQATGLPLVVTNSRGNRDLITDGKNGFIVNIDDIDCFSNKVLEIFHSKNMMEKFSNNNLKDVEKYSIDIIMEKMKLIYGI